MQLFKRYPVRSTLAVVLAMTGVLAAGIWSAISGAWSIWPWALAWLASLNVTTFGTYGYDKWQAKQGGWRIPEITLWALASIGGFAGAWLGMKLFRHKTIKGSFRIMFWLLAAVQVVAMAALIKLSWF